MGHDIMLTPSGAQDVLTLAIIFGVGGAVALTAVLGSFIASIVRTRARERTKREVAAYVAEGSITPADAERILEAGGDRDTSGSS